PSDTYTLSLHDALPISKAVAEWIVASAGTDAAEGRYASVRLGNVVDSAGSILPIFRKQVAGGGPITVTHRQATRYMITAGEAAGDRKSTRLNSSHEWIS